MIVLPERSFFEECPYRRRQIVPPNGETEIDRVVLSHNVSVNVGGKRRTDFIVQLVFRTVGAGSVILTVGFLRDDTEQLAARFLRDPPCHLLPVARPRKVGDKNFALPGNACLRFVVDSSVGTAKEPWEKQRRCRDDNDDNSDNDPNFLFHRVPPCI